jgi:hypothetical protein
MPFFSPPHLHDDPRLRIAEHATHRCQWAQPRKPVRVLQPSLFAHRQIMPSFALRSKRSNPCTARLPSTNHHIFYPLDSVKTLFF